MAFNDEKNINGTEPEEQSKISDDAANALESGLFEEKEDFAQPEETAASDKDLQEKEQKEKKKRKRKNPFSSRKFKKGIFALVLTCLVVAAVIIINIIIGVLQTKVPAMSVDMTGQNLYGLSDSSKELVDKVDKEITITVLGAEDKYTKADQNFLQANNLLKKYSMENDKIKIKYVDLTANPNYINNYPNESLTAYSYIVSCGDKYKYLDKSTELFTLGTDYTTGQTYVEASNVENAVTGAISYVTSENTTKIAVLNGFGDNTATNLSTFTTLLKNNNYEIVDTDLLTADIDIKCDMAILYQPTADLTDDAVDRINKFLNNDGKYGKNLFYVPPEKYVDSPNIDSLLEEWGMSIGQGLIADTDTAHMPFQGDYYCSVFDYTSSSYAEGLSDTTKYLIGVYTRPVLINDNAKVTPLATTSESSAVHSFDADENWDPTQHIEGSLNAGAVSVKTGDEKNSTVTVWGSDMSFYTQFLNSSTFINGEYFVNLFNTLTGREESDIVIDSKSLQSDQLGIMSDQITVIGTIFAWVIPLAVLLVGIIVWIRRRHK